MQKPTEIWILICVLAVYLVHRAQHLQWWSRLLNAAIAAGLTLAMGETVASWLGGNEIYATILIMLVGQNVLDWMSVIASDREFAVDTLKAWVRKSLGVEKNDT